MKNLAIVLTLVLSSCVTLRNSSVYQAEIAFANRVVHLSAPEVRHAIATECTCADGHWTTAAGSSASPSTVCNDRVEWWLMYAARWPWHNAMMRYNGSLTNTNPGAAPAIPAQTCDLPADPGGN